MTHDSPAGGTGVSGALSPKFLAATVLIAALTFMALFSLPLFRGEIFLEDDLSAVFIPLRYFYAECLKAGDSFLWLPNIYNGFYLQGESQTGMTHPLHLVMYRYLSFTQAFDLDLLMSYPFMFAGAVLFLRRWKLPMHAVLFGALLCTFSGYPISRWLYMVHTGVLAHAPWLLYCIDVAMRDRKPSRIVFASLGIVALTTSAILMGYPHLVFIMGLVEGMYALTLLRASPQRWCIVLLLVAKLLAVACGAIQLLPTYDLAVHSTRAGLDLEQRMWGSQHPLNLMQLVSPYFAHQRTFLYVGYDTFYGGALPTIFAAWLLLRWRRLKVSRAMVACFGLTAVLGAVLTLGRYGYLYPLMAQLPIFNMFRGAARHGAMFHLGWVFLAVLAYTELHRMLTRNERASMKELAPLLILPLLSALMVVLVFIAHRYPDGSALLEELDREFAPTRNAAVGTGLMLVATGLFFATARGWRPGLLALLIFTFADLGMYGFRHKTVGDFETFRSEIDVPSEAPDWKLEPDRLPTYNIMGTLMHGYSTPAGRASLEPTRRLDYYLNETPLRASGVKWLRTRIGTTVELNRFAEEGIEWLEVPEPMPRARLITRTVVSDDPSRDIEDIDLATTALVDVDLPLEPGVPGAAQVIEDRPGIVRVAVDAPTRQLLVLTESYYPGWRVSVDGGSVEALRVNGDFLGCIVEAGQREVVFDFDPDSWRQGKLVTVAGVLLTLIFHIGLFGRLRRRQLAS